MDVIKAASVDDLVYELAAANIVQLVLVDGATINSKNAIAAPVKGKYKIRRFEHRVVVGYVSGPSKTEVGISPVRGLSIKDAYYKVKLDAIKAYSYLA